jgi:hypothetical protein
MRIQPLTGSRGLLTLTSMTCLATAVACSSGSAPELSGLTDQVAQVGTELKIDLLGTDADGDQLSYRYSIPDLQDDTAQITQSPSGAGVFRWHEREVERALRASLSLVAHQARRREHLEGSARRRHGSEVLAQTLTQVRHLRRK